MSASELNLRRLPGTKVAEGTVLRNTLPDELKGIISAHKFVVCVKQLIATGDTR